MIDLTQTIPHLGFTVTQLLIAALILMIGWLVAKVIVSLFRRLMQKTDLPQLMETFMTRFLSIFLYICVILITISYLGVEVGSVVIGLSAGIGLVLAFGLRDTLNNLAAGAWLSTVRPFHQGERVVIEDFEGDVRAVGTMSTELVTSDNTFITLPNNLVWQSPMINYSRLDKRRVGVDVGIGYESDIDEAIKIALRTMRSNDLVLTEPNEPDVTVSSLGESAINIKLKAWTENEDYWTLKHQLTKSIVKEYNKAGIEIPYPTLDVNLKK